MNKTRVTLPRLRPPSAPLLVERLSLDVASDSPDVSALMQTSSGRGSQTRSGHGIFTASWTLDSSQRR